MTKGGLLSFSVVFIYLKTINKQYSKWYNYSYTETKSFKVKLAQFSTKCSSVKITESVTGWHSLLPWMANIVERSKEKDNKQCIQESVWW